MPNSAESELVVTAYHEAGHAVLAHEQRRPVRLVTIVAGPRSLGHCSVQPPPYFEPDTQTNGRTREAVERYASYLCAGLVAEQFLTGHHDSEPGRVDLKEAIRFISMQCGSDEESDLFFRMVWVRTANTLRKADHWKALDAVAQQLLKRGEMTSRRVSETIRASRAEKPGCGKCEQRASVFDPVQHAMMCHEHRLEYVSTFPRLD